MPSLPSLRSMLMASLLRLILVSSLLPEFIQFRYLFLCEGERLLYICEAVLSFLSSLSNSGHGESSAPLCYFLSHIPFDLAISIFFNPYLVIRFSFIIFLHFFLFSSDHTLLSFLGVNF